MNKYKKIISGNSTSRIYTNELPNKIFDLYMRRKKVHLQVSETNLDTSQLRKRKNQSHHRFYIVNNINTK